ncbi:MAG: hypothetical protein H0U53_09940, partial [Actinobacteria bacterium]|nr:hypothetical protein [Actinomycetota bacterium]
MKGRAKGLIVMVAVVAATLLPVAPSSAADCTEDVNMCLGKVFCSVAGGANKVGNKVGTGDLVY